MSDRFKFRIWEIKEKRYNKYPPYGYQGGTFNMFSTDESLIEQCTGLKDKNGKLIYENDYVTHKGNIYKVFWNKTKISLENILNNDIIDIQEFDCMEVIGNEHEKGNIRKI